MNATELKLVALIEDCAELQMAAGRALRIGVSERHPESGITHAQEIIDAFSTVVARMEDLQKFLPKESAGKSE